MTQYRIVERLPGKFCIQRRHQWLWWGFWIYQGDFYGGYYEYHSPEKAEEIVRAWLAIDGHKMRVIKEVRA